MLIQAMITSIFTNDSISQISTPLVRYSWGCSKVGRRMIIKGWGQESQEPGKWDLAWLNVDSCFLVLPSLPDHFSQTKTHSVLNVVTIFLVINIIWRDYWKGLLYNINEVIHVKDQKCGHPQHEQLLFYSFYLFITSFSF